MGTGNLIEHREDGVVKSLTVKIKGWRIINNEDGSPKTDSIIRHTHWVEGTDLRKRISGLDKTGVAEIEETFNMDIPEEHQSDKIHYLDKYRDHDHTQGDAGDIEYSTKRKEWVKLLNDTETQTGKDF